EVADIVRTYGEAFLIRHRRWITGLNLSARRCTQWGVPSKVPGRSGASFSATQACSGWSIGSSARPQLLPPYCAPLPTVNGSSMPSDLLPDLPKSSPISLVILTASPSPTLASRVTAPNLYPTPAGARLELWLLLPSTAQSHLRCFSHSLIPKIRPHHSDQ